MKLLSKNSIERTFWVVLLAAALYTTIVGTNYVRDHKVYKEAAVRCSGDISALSQEVEKALAEKEKVSQENSTLKSLPVR